MQMDQISRSAVSSRALWRFFVFLFFSEIYPLKKCFVSYTLKYLLNLLAGQFCLCSLLKEDKTQKKKDLKSSD